MNDFKFYCPVCSQYIHSNPAMAGNAMECPTCFQPIVVPQPAASDDPKCILTATRYTEKKLPANGIRPDVRSDRKNFMAPSASTKPFSVAPLAIGLLVLVLGVGGFLLFGQLSGSSADSGQVIPAGSAPAYQASPPSPAVSAASDPNVNPPLPLELSAGRVGVGTWNTQIAVSNLVVTSGGQVLYRSDFFHSQPRGWTMGPGEWVAFNGVMEQLAGGTDPMAVVGEDTWSHYVYKTRFAKLGGAQGIILLFNFKTIKNYAQFNIGGWDNTSNGIETVANGNRVVGARVPFSVKNNQWYDVELDVSNNNVHCYIDGQLNLSVGN